MKTHEGNAETYLEPTREARDALAQVGLKSAAEQDDYYRKLAKAVREAQESQATQDGIELAMRDVGSLERIEADDVTVSAFSSEYDRPLY